MINTKKFSYNLLLINVLFNFLTTLSICEKIASEVDYSFINRTYIMEIINSIQTHNKVIKTLVKKKHWLSNALLKLPGTLNIKTSLRKLASILPFNFDKIQ